MLKKMCLFAIICYQKCVSPFLATHCRYYPSCSEYAREVFMFQNPLVATFKTLTRILSCNQMFKGGIAYPKISIVLHINTFKPCAIKYWLIPSKTQKFNLKNISSVSQTFHLIKTDSKVSRVKEN